MKHNEVMIYLIIQSATFAVFLHAYFLREGKVISEIGIQNHPNKEPREVGKNTIQIFILIVISSVIISPNNDLL